jgi:hypothetical protein
MVLLTQEIYAEWFGFCAVCSLVLMVGFGNCLLNGL